MTATVKETPTVISEAVAWSVGWGQIAEFLTSHPEIAEHTSVDSTSGRALCFLGHLVEDPVRFIADAVQTCLEAGGWVEQKVRDELGGVNLWFGPVHIYVYADVDRLFSRRVTGMVEQVEYTLTFDLPEQGQAAAR